MALRANREKPYLEVISLRLEPELVKRLRALAEENERTISAEARIAVRRYLAESAA